MISERVFPHAPYNWVSSDILLFTQSISWNTSIFHCQFFGFNTFLSTVFFISLFIHSPRWLSILGSTHSGTDSWGTSLGQLSIVTTWPFVAAFYYLLINPLLICESTTSFIPWHIVPLRACIMQGSSWSFRIKVLQYMKCIPPLKSLISIVYVYSESII